MKAVELINKVVVELFRKDAHVRAIIDDGKDSWFHVHKDEELPTDYPVIVYVRT